MASPIMFLLFTLNNNIKWTLFTMTSILKKSNFLHQPVLYKYQSDYTQKVTVKQKETNCNKAKQRNFLINGNTVTNFSIITVFSSFHYLIVSHQEHSRFVLLVLIYLMKHNPSLKWKWECCSNLACVINFINHRK